MTIQKVVVASLVGLLLAVQRGRAEEPPRQLDEILPKLTRELTPAQAEQALGCPDEVTGSGLLIYVYRVENDQSVWLFFPGYEPIQRAAVRSSTGVLEDLPLQ